MIKVAIIGVGRRGAMPLDNFPSNRARLTAVAETDPAMLDAFRKNPLAQGVAIFTDYREMLQLCEVDAVFIMVRDFLHEEIAVAALEAGKAVFLEKPMAISIAGCDRILETAYRTGSRLFIGHNLRYAPFVVKMKELVDAGLIGEIQAVWVRHFVGYGSCYFRHWCAERKNSTGLLLQKGAHDIDVIHAICGSYTCRAVGMGRLSVYNRTADRRGREEAPDRALSFTPECWPPLALQGLSPDLDVEDHSMVMMQLENGIQASYSQCMYTPDSDRNYTFIGTHGRLENMGSLDAGAEIHVWTRRDSRPEPDMIVKVPTLAGTHGGADAIMMKAFFDFLAGKRPADPSPVAARQAVAVGVLAHESMRNGNLPREIPPLPANLLEYFVKGQKR